VLDDIFNSMHIDKENCGMSVTSDFEKSFDTQKRRGETIRIGTNLRQTPRFVRSLRILNSANLIGRRRRCSLL